MCGNPWNNIKRRLLNTLNVPSTAAHSRFLFVLLTFEQLTGKVATGYCAVCKCRNYFYIYTHSKSARNNFIARFLLTTSTSKVITQQLECNEMTCRAAYWKYMQDTVARCYNASSSKVVHTSYIHIWLSHTHTHPHRYTPTRGVASPYSSGLLPARSELMSESSPLTDPCLNWRKLVNKWTGKLVLLTSQSRSHTQAEPETPVNSSALAHTHKQAKDFLTPGAVTAAWTVLYWN